MKKLAACFYANYNETVVRFFPLTPEETRYVL